MREIVDFQYREKGKDELNNKKHSHNNCYEILQTWAGQGVIMIKNKLYPIGKGTIYFINGVDIHCSGPKDTEGYIRNKIIISAPFIDTVARAARCESVLDALFRNEGGRFVQPGQHQAEAIDGEFLRMSEALARNDECTAIGVAAAVFNIISFAYKNGADSGAALNNQISDILQYINKNIAQKISLDDIGKYMHASKYYLCHIFKEATHMTITEYIMSRRISIAKKKLLYTDSPLSDIAVSLGFSSFSYFSRAFRDFEGMTPSEFRKLNLGKKRE